MNGSPGKGAPTVPPVDEEDDLPPRMDSTHASPRVAPVPLPGSGKNTPTPSRPSTPSNDPSSHIPIYAGFDLNAIKNALQEVEQKASQTPSSSTSPPPPPKSLTQLSPPPIAPPSNRSQSTPPVQVVGADAHPRASSFDYGYGASQSPSEDKSPTGMGLGYGHPSRDGATFAGPSHPYPRSYSASSRLEENDISSSSYSSSFARTPLATNSFSSEFDDAYAIHTPRPITHTLGLPDDVVPSWGAPNSSSPSSFTFSSSATTKSSMINPFSNPSLVHGLGFSESPGLSFGSADGAIVAPSGGQNDGWGIPPLGMALKKKSTLDGFNSNPWS